MWTTDFIAVSSLISIANAVIFSHQTSSQEPEAPSGLLSWSRLSGHSTIDMLATVEFLIQPDENDAQERRHDDGQS